MKKYFVLLVVALFVVCVKTEAGHLKVSDAASLEIAKATLKAHGGEKLGQIKSMVLRGSAELTAPNAPSALPASFAIILSGERYRFEIQSLAFNFSQISDGQNTSSSMAGISLPPINKVGLTILPKIEESGYVVSPLPEKFKKKKGFRITTPEGYYSDFVIDEKTSLVKEFESSYDLNGRTVSTAIAIDKYKEVDGLLINEKFSQRIDIGNISAYANFTAKSIQVNSAIADDIFTIK
jgi:hypothetical protein